MAGSLQDQLLGAGLIKKQKAKNIQTAKKKAVKQSRSNKTKLVNEATELAEKARNKQRRQSQSLNDRHKLEAEQKALQAQIRQIITLNSIERVSAKASDSALAYNFNDNNKIKTLYVSPQNHDSISRGKIAIVTLNYNNADEAADDYHLIPASAANKIKERDTDSVILLNDDAVKKMSEDSDDIYADYEIPDDLMW